MGTEMLMMTDFHDRIAPLGQVERVYVTCLKGSFFTANPAVTAIFDEHAEWLSKHGTGYGTKFAVAGVRRPGAPAESNFCYEFSDPNTAFEFKLKFG
ncbi:MAG: hypothetical protein EOP83_01145 [Verrucomicrobiaceae bacterium]|nr:MAG: hypothetical protein EOP83_01145 [Verrucomicrobiaceae bacterium]